MYQTRPVWRRSVLLSALLLAVSGVAARAATATGAPSAPPAQLPADAVAGLPAGAAAAAFDSEPARPVPSAWPFPDAFSRTAGTGRLIGGAFEWTDWVDDAFGAAVTGSATNSDLAQAHGGYMYPAGPADGDGADIFRAAVGLTPASTVWRVDWSTLADPSIPIAEWTFDTDDDAATGGSVWPARANVVSPGIEKALVVSAKGAELIDVPTGRTIANFPTEVSTRAQSFVVSVPRSVLSVSGRWRIRLAAGLADPAGKSFAAPTETGGQRAPATAPRIYNITFRTAAQEPPTYGKKPVGLSGAPVVGPYHVDGIESEATGNTWNDADQAADLATGNVSKFSEPITWSQLAAKTETQPPLVYGWSSRWYETDLNLGQGIATGATTQPQLLQRIQPYAVYVPTGYNAKTAVPLTWVLHGASQNYMWAAAGEPRLTAEACQARRSICASPEGFGPVGYYAGTAEHDFWQVWRQVALGFHVADDRTVIDHSSSRPHTHPCSAKPCPWTVATTPDARRCRPGCRIWPGPPPRTGRETCIGCR